MEWSVFAGQLLSLRSRAEMGGWHPQQGQARTVFSIGCFGIGEFKQEAACATQMSLLSPAEIHSLKHAKCKEYASHSIGDHVHISVERYKLLVSYTASFDIVLKLFLP